MHAGRVCLVEKVANHESWNRVVRGDQAHDEMAVLFPLERRSKRGFSPCASLPHFLQRSSYVHYIVQVHEHCTGSREYHPAIVVSSSSSSSGGVHSPPIVRPPTPLESLQELRDEQSINSVQQVQQQQQQQQRRKTRNSRARAMRARPVASLAPRDISDR